MRFSFIVQLTTESVNIEAVTEIKWIVAYSAGDLNGVAIRGDQPYKELKS